MERWRARTEGWIHSSPVLLDELVYVGSNDGALHFIDRRTGVHRWRYGTPRAIRATPAIAEGLIFFGGEDGWFRAIDAHTLGGRSTYSWRWVHTRSSSGYPVRQRLSQACGGRTVPPLWPGRLLRTTSSMWPRSTALLRRLSCAHGTLRWSFAARKAISASLVVAGEVLYVASYDQTLTALDARDGTIRWQFAAGGPIHATRVVSDGRVYVAAMDGVVYPLR